MLWQLVWPWRLLWLCSQVTQLKHLSRWYWKCTSLGMFERQLSQSWEWNLQGYSVHVHRLHVQNQLNLGARMAHSLPLDTHWFPCLWFLWRALEKPICALFSLSLMALVGCQVDLGHFQISKKDNLDLSLINIYRQDLKAFGSCF